MLLVQKKKYYLFNFARGAVLLACFFIYFCLPVFAVSENFYVQQERYEQQQKARQLDREYRQRVNEVKVNIPLPKLEIEQPQISDKLSEVKFYIKDFVIDDCGSKKFQWLYKYVEKYNNKKITLKDIFAIQKTLSEAVLKKGYVTSQVLIPEQDFKTDKVVKFVIVPGYIERISFFYDEDLMGTCKNAFPCGPGDVLNTFDLEQGLEQMRRAGNQDVTMEIVAGDKVGCSIVLLYVNRSKSWSVDVSLDDAGQKSTGKREMTTSLTLYNPTGLNDIFSIGYTKDVVGHDKDFGIHNNSFYYSVPYQDFTFTAAKYYNKYRQTTPLLADDFYQYEGATDTWEIGADALLYRDSIRKTQLATKLLRRHKRGEDNIIGRVPSQELDTAAYQVGIHHRQYEGKGTFDVLLYYQKGIPSCGAKPGYEDNVQDGATTRYKMIGWNFYYGTPIKFGSWKTRFSTIFRGQLTSDKLYGTDHISIGGRYSVRGYDGENTLAAENGYLWRNEYAFQLTKLRHEIYFGIDYGKVWGQSDEFNIGNYLVGAFAGIRGNLTNQITYDVFVGSPIKKPKGFKADTKTYGFNLNMSL